MASAPPEQRQRALAGQATLLRARALDPLQAAWNELLRELDDPRWQALAATARRTRQDIQIAFERYVAQACSEPPRIDDGEALAALARCITQLSEATNATIDELAAMSSEAMRKRASSLDSLVVALHRWLAELDRLDAGWRGPAPSPAPSMPPVSALPTTSAGGEAASAVEIPSWPPPVERDPPPRAWWPVGEARASSPWSRHGADDSPS